MLLVVMSPIIEDTKINITSKKPRYSKHVNGNKTNSRDTVRQQSKIGSKCGENDYRGSGMQCITRLK